MATSSIVGTAKPSGWDLLAISLAAGLLFFGHLGARDLWNPNEPTYGRATAEMAERGEWLIPTVNGKVFAEKPILYFWGALAAAELTGRVDELSLRLPAAVAGSASVLLTYWLVVPYAGRRRAWLTVALLMTLYEVFWVSRAVQMDVFVLASTLGVILPLTRLLDFQARPAPAFAFAGLAAGLGFLGKGPVTLIVPGLVLAIYAASTGRLDRLLRPQALIGVAVAIGVSLPWLATLWLRGEVDFLAEVLFRQNFTRFLDAWDHQQPWWYYLKYLGINYAPWSWLLPAAWWTAPRSDEDRHLRRLGWIWIVAVIAFFSLSESKRAPYIVPIAPAVAMLAAGVIERWMFGGWPRRWPRVAATLTFAAWALILTVAGLAVLALDLDVPQALAPVAWVFGSLALASGLAVGCGLLLARRRPAVAPIALLAYFGMLYTLAAIWALPAADPLKSARGFAAEMDNRLETADGTVASYKFWDWRAGCSYYADRSIQNLADAAELVSYWRQDTVAHVLVEGENEPELRSLLPGARLVAHGKIGSREAFLFAKKDP